MSCRILLFVWIFSLSLLFFMTPGVSTGEETVPEALYFAPTGILGQGSYYSSAANKVDGLGFNYPSSVAIDGNITPNHLYVADTDNNRVLCWGNIDDAFAGKPADKVLGQPNLYTNRDNSEDVLPVTLYEPKGLWVDDRGYLYVCDSLDNRVLVFEPPIHDDVFPEFVIGQSSYYQNAPDAGGPVSDFGFNYPSNVLVTSDHTVFISDMYNNRTLGFEDPADPGKDSLADIVLGQPNFSSYFANQGSASPNDSSLFYPAGLALDQEGNLWNADSNNNRIVMYPYPFNVSGNQSVVKLGQPDFASSYINWDGVNNNDNFSGAYPSGLELPEDVLIDASGRLYVADTWNNRVLRWDDPTSPTDINADFVFGQGGDFYTEAPNYQGTPGADSMDAPTGLNMDAMGRLYVVDRGNHRVLRFDSPGDDYNASAVCGQVTMSGGAPNRLDAAGLDYPYDIAFDYNSSSLHVYVVDQTNNRVLGWESWQDALAGASADIILGQPDEYSNDGGCDRNKFYFPTAVNVDSNSVVWVSDSQNSRVVGFEDPFTKDLLGDYLLGQTSFVEAYANGQTGTPGASTLNFPGGIDATPTGTGLWVADNANNRVLFYSDPYNIGPAASIAVGQQSMSGANPNDPDVSEKTLNGPLDVFVDISNNLYVCDSFNNRVLLYYPPHSTGEGADRVFGQLDQFNTNEQDIGSTVSAFGLNTPSSVAYSDRDILFVSDASNSRILGYFKPSDPAQDTAADIVYGQNGCFSCGGYATMTDVGPDNLSNPNGLALFKEDRLFVADSGHNRIMVFDLYDPPEIVSAVLVDTDYNSSIDEGDLLILHFPDPLMKDPDAVFDAGDFNLTRSGDSLGTGFDVFVSELNPNSLIIALGVSPVLIIPGTGTSSSSIDVTTSISPKLISARTALPVIPSTPVDMKYMFRSPMPRYIGSEGGTMQVLDDSDALFTGHNLYLPPGVVSESFLFGIYPPVIQLPYLSAVTIDAVSEAYITLEFLPESIDLEGGFLPKYIRMAVMVEVSPGVWEPDWREVPFEIDFDNNTITIKLADLYGAGGKKPWNGTKYGIDGDTIIADARDLVDENSINVQPATGGARSSGGSSPAVLMPGSDCIYTRHQITIPDYEEIASGGYEITIRQALSSERSGFPAQSGAIFVVESTPDFPWDHAVNITVQYVKDEAPELTDVVNLLGSPGSEGKLRLVKRDPDTGDFNFVTGYEDVTIDTENHTLTTTGLFELTDDGSGVYGLLVDEGAESLTTAAKAWTLYE